MKILFYLPAVTPWWFETIITPMLRSLYREAELHVIVAPLWRNTGLDMSHVEPLADLPAINWHIVSADDPWQFRMEGAAVDGLLDLVRAIDPDITLARSADRATPARFPGIVRHIMEPGAEPFHTPHRWFILDEQPFHHGVMPTGVTDKVQQAAALMAPFWEAMEAEYARLCPQAMREVLGLPLERPILAVPLQYEHEENFYGFGSPLQNGPDFIRTLLAHLDADIMLAIADHPLNAKFLARDDLDRIAVEYPDRVRLFPVEDEHRSAANLLIHAADAVLIDRSKCVSLAAFLGTPIIHVGDGLMAEWLNATPLAELMPERLRNRGLPAPARDQAKLWFGWHFGMRLTNFSTVTLQTVQDRVFNRTSDHEMREMLSFIAPWCEAAVKSAEHSVSRAAEAGQGRQRAA